MRKLLFTFVVLLAVSGFAAAQDIVVDRIQGQAVIETAPGTWQAITVGQVFQLTDVIKVKLSSTLVLKIGDEYVSLKTGQRGTVARLIFGKVKAEAIVAKLAQAGYSTGQSQVSRASEAVEDTEWVD